MGRILQMHANHRQDIETAYMQAISLRLSVLKNTTTGDTLCDEKHPIILESMEFPEPVIRVAIEPKTKAGQEKMGIALAKLAEEDPTFKTYTDEETGQTIIAGMGELHLEIIVDRLLREFKVEANVGTPQVAYKETIRKAGRRRSASMPVSPAVRASTVMLRSSLSRTSPARAMSLSTQIVGGAIPKEYIPAGRSGYPGRNAVRCPRRLSRLLTLRSRCTTVLTTRSTPLKWRLRSPVPWRSRRLCRRLIRFCWSRS